MSQWTPILPLAGRRFNVRDYGSRGCAASPHCGGGVGYSLHDSVRDEATLLMLPIVNWVGKSYQGCLIVMVVEITSVLNNPADGV